MKRLREMPASSRLIDQVQRLIDAAPPIPESSAVMQRIRRTLDAPRPSGAGRLLQVPAFALAGGLLLLGATAFAAVRTWVEYRVAPPPAARIIEAPLADEPARLVPETIPQLLADEPASVREPAVREANRRPSAADERVRSRAQPARRANPGLSAADARARARVQSTPRQSPLRDSQHPSATRATRSSASRTTAPPMSAVAAARGTAPRTAAVAASRARVATATEATDEVDAIPEPAQLSRAAKRSSDSELVVRAVRVLRRDHDPALASRLLERYHARNPAGALAEEVLSLQIEAAVAAEDPRADSFARKYLASYPDGRYRERAERAVEGGTP